MTAGSTPTTPRPNRRLSSLVRTAIAFVLVCLVGCRGGAALTTSPSPYGYDEQAARILTIAPLGTDRAEAVRKLEQAGIKGSFGISQSTYYCDVWQHDDGRRWQLDVALLFDEQGKLYQTRQGDAHVEREHAPGSHAANEPSTLQADGADNPPPRTAETSRRLPREAERTPFRDEP